ncbi:hypothetical protein ACFL1E_07420 [Candidatus Omnitrophota bacterium]
MFFRRGNRNGFAIILTFIIFTFLIAIAGGVFLSVMGDFFSSTRQIGNIRATWLAEAGLREKMLEIEDAFDNNDFSSLPAAFPTNADQVGDTCSWAEADFPTGDPQGTYIASARLVSVDVVDENGDGEEAYPDPGNYIYLLTAQGTASILGGTTTQEVQCSVKYAQIITRNVSIRDRTLGRNHITFWHNNIIHFGKLNLPVGKYDLSYKAKYSKGHGVGLPPFMPAHPLEEENAYFQFDDSLVMIQEWIDNGDGVAEDGFTPCIADDGVVCEGEFDIPWDLQTTRWEIFDHIAEGGVHADLQYFFEVGTDPVIAEFSCIHEGNIGEWKGSCEGDLDLTDEYSKCNAMCAPAEGCLGVECSQRCFDSCIAEGGFQEEHPDSECHRRCNPAHCMKWCAHEFQRGYSLSECSLACGNDSGCMDACVLEEKAGDIGGRQQCANFCNIDDPYDPSFCLDECRAWFQVVYNETGTYTSECHRMCDDITSRQMCIDNCDALFFRGDIRGDLVIRAAIPQYVNQQERLQGQIRFSTFTIVPEESGATITEVIWLTNP